MNTQDDDLRLEPPQGQPPTPAGWSPAPPPPANQPQQQPPAERRPADDLEPGRGRPLVEGPPMSVDEPIPEQSITRTAAYAGIGLLGLGLIVAIVLILVLVFAVCGHH
ncbi:MAG TPA: hypothetical protein VGO86_01500 [Candidatus Dormibacteraeota bacterium]